MDKLIQLIRCTSVNDSFYCWEELKKQNKEHAFTVDINSIIRELHNQYFVPSEMGYLFYLASNPASRAPEKGSVFLSARGIDKIIRRIWREQMRQHRKSRRADYFDDGAIF